MHALWGEWQGGTFEGAFEGGPHRGAVRPQWRAFCTHARAHLKHSQSARASVTVCAAGTGGAACSGCSVGTWSAGGNATVPKQTCTACPTSFTTSGTGATSKAACSVKKGALRSLV